MKGVELTPVTQNETTQNETSQAAEGSKVHCKGKMTSTLKIGNTMVKQHIHSILSKG